VSVYDSLEFFKADEFDYPDQMDEEFLLWLDEVRSAAGVPMVITSDFRPSDDDSTHSLGIAVDVAAASGRWRYLIVKAALACGAKRLGVYDKHIHLELPVGRHKLPEHIPTPSLWAGKSK